MTFHSWLDGLTASFCFAFIRRAAIISPKIQRNLLHELAAPHKNPESYSNSQHQPDRRLIRRAGLCIKTAHIDTSRRKLLWRGHADVRLVLTDLKPWNQTIYGVMVTGIACVVVEQAWEMWVYQSNRSFVGLYRRLNKHLNAATYWLILMGRCLHLTGYQSMIGETARLWLTEECISRTCEVIFEGRESTEEQVWGFINGCSSFCCQGLVGLSLWHTGCAPVKLHKTVV